MLNLSEEQQRNWLLAKEINTQARSSEGSPLSGKYVGIVRQSVVAVADSLDGLEAQLDAINADPAESVCVEASADYDQTYFVWMLL